MSLQKNLDTPDLSINRICNSKKYNHTNSEIVPDRSKNFLPLFTYNHDQEMSLTESDRDQNNFELAMTSREHINSIKSELEVSSIEKRTDADMIFNNTLFIDQQPSQSSSEKYYKNINTIQMKITKNKFPQLQGEADKKEKILPTESSRSQKTKIVHLIDPDRFDDEIKEDISMPLSIKINLSDEEEKQQALPEKTPLNELQEANKRETSTLKKTENLGANSLKANREESFESIQNDQKSDSTCRLPSQQEERREELEDQHPEEEDSEILELLNQMQQTLQDNRSTNTVIPQFFKSLFEELAGQQQAKQLDTSLSCPISSEQTKIM